MSNKELAERLDALHQDLHFPIYVKHDREAAQKLLRTTASALRENERLREALEKIGNVGDSDEYPESEGRQLCLRCKSCGYRWRADKQPKHADTCAAMIARRALEGETPTQEGDK